MAEAEFKYNSRREYLAKMRSEQLKEERIRRLTGEIRERSPRRS